MKSDELKEAMKESPRRYTNPFLSDEENEKVNFWNNQQLKSSNITDDCTDNCGDEKFGKCLAPCNVPLEFFEKETEFYTYKNVMERKLPEFLVCYKESAFHVKDICVDEGIPHGEKILFEEDNPEILCNSSLANEDKHDDLIEGSLHTQFLKPELLRFSPMEDCYMKSDICSVNEEKLDTDLPILEHNNDPQDIGDNRDEVLERNLHIELLKSERMRSSSREDCCMKSDASSLTKEVDTDSPFPGLTTDHRNMGNISIDSGIPVQDGQSSIQEKDCVDDSTKEFGTKEEVVIDLVIPSESRNMSKDDNGDDHGPSTCAPYKLKFSAESDTVPKANDNCGADPSMQTGEEQINSSANFMDEASTDQLVSNSMPSLKHDPHLPSLQFLLESSNGARDVDQQPCQSSVEEISEKPLVGYEAEELGRSLENTNISNESTMDGNITLDLKNGKPATCRGLHGVENQELCLEVQGAPSHQDVASENVAMVNPVQCGEGESSVSMTGPVSGRITYSGPVAFSGSISLRSDSSTASTRSFAFPILQTEWNSSPVRMAKADRRRLPKHRGWRHGLLCCRF